MATGRLGSTWRTVLMWATGVAFAAAIVAAVVISLWQPKSVADQLWQRAAPADLSLRETKAALDISQATFLTALASQDANARGTDIAQANAYGQKADSAWAVYKSRALHAPGEAALQQAYDAQNASGRRLGGQLVSISTTSPSYPGVLSSQRAGYDAQVATLATLQSTIYQPVLSAAGGKIDNGISRTRIIVLAGFAVLGSVFTLLTAALLRGARRDQRAMTREAIAMRTARQQAEFDASLQGALDMAPSEQSTLDVIKRALGIISPGTPAELLLADASHAHFRQVLSTDPDPSNGCQVASPTECPAAIGGHTRVFGDSTDLNTCRFLAAHGDHVWAVCVPLSIAGRATGVIHAQEPFGNPLPERLHVDLEVVARKAGDRIGNLRILARTEAQAQTDPLTGLPNRRTLDAQMHDLLTQGTAYVTAFADLDHFKAINDVHGHDTGDHALRLFARVLRDSIRPRDLVARHGGEEFVVVLPECSLADARIVAERVRTELARALSHSPLPPFTVTIGLAPSEPGDAFSEVIARADAAMLTAKALGRDRVLAHGDVPGPPAPPLAASPTPAPSATPSPPPAVPSGPQTVPPVVTVAAAGSRG